MGRMTCTRQQCYLCAAEHGVFDKHSESRNVWSKRSGSAAGHGRRAPCGQKDLPCAASLASHLGFGKKLIHGAPDVGSLIPAGTRDCNPTDVRATTKAHRDLRRATRTAGPSIDGPAAPRTNDQDYSRP